MGGCRESRARVHSNPSSTAIFDRRKTPDFLEKSGVLCFLGPVYRGRWLAASLLNAVSSPWSKSLRVRNSQGCSSEVSITLDT